MNRSEAANGSSKASSGIEGLDSILMGGYPARRASLIMGEAGSGKTTLSLFFLVAGLQAGESVVLVTCSEPPEHMIEYIDGYGFPGTGWAADGRLRIVDLRPNPTDIVAGEYELTPILLRVENAVKTSEATRLVIDMLENLDVAFQDSGRPRRELQQLFSWVAGTGLTTIMNCGTPHASASAGILAEYLAEYYAGCVIKLSQRVENRLMTRVLRIVKLRGSGHGTDEYPFSMDAQGVGILPISDVLLNAEASMEQLSTGLAELDDMLGGDGYYTGSIAMVSGLVGTGKSTFAAQFCKAALDAGRRALFVSFEEPRTEILRNMKSVGIDLGPHLADGSLDMFSVRPTEAGLETHLLNLARRIDDGNRDVVVLDPISAFIDMGRPTEIKIMLLRLIDFLKLRGVTTVMTELVRSGVNPVDQIAVSSLTNIWIELRAIESNGEFNRLLYILKSRGLPGSNQVREFRITNQGIMIEDIYIGTGSMVFGAARAARQVIEEEEIENRDAVLQRVREALDLEQRAFKARQREIDAEHAARMQDLESEVRAIERRIATEQEARADIRRTRG